MNLHFIAIGGAIMHNLALCLQNTGHNVTGSDDIIFDPAKRNLEKAHLLPEENGFFAKNVHKGIDAIILGMHAKKDNVELLKAQELGIKIYSFPEFIYEQSKNKKRIVVGGSHGKTTTTAMIMHVMKSLKFDFDYLVGSSLEGFELSVKLSDAPIIVLEGDEYLSSPIEMTSKFHYYHPDIAIITGVAWDHVNVFPTWESYVETFDTFLKNMTPESQAILFSEDETLQTISTNKKTNITFYKTPTYSIENEDTTVSHEGESYALQIFGKHNLENMEAARLACEGLDINAASFYKAISTFKGTAKRLEKIANNFKITAYRDFAHSPSKLEATLNSVEEQYASKKLIACMELHTYSSTDANFLSEYKDSMQKAHLSVVYMSEKAFSIKNRTEISDETVKECFNQKSILIARDPVQLLKILNDYLSEEYVFLLMSSGSFDGVDWTDFLNQTPKQ